MEIVTYPSKGSRWNGGRSKRNAVSPAVLLPLSAAVTLPMVTDLFLPAITNLVWQGLGVATCFLVPVVIFEFFCTEKRPQDWLASTASQPFWKMLRGTSYGRDRKINRFPVITIIMIAVNTVFFFTIPEDMLDHLFSLPLDDFGLLHLVLTTVAGAFFHLDAGHFFINMFFLWIFGALLEPGIAPGQYLAAVLLGSVLFGLIRLNLLVVQGGLFDASYTLLRYPPAGASGAISGLMGLFALRYGTPWRSTSRPKRCPLSFLFSLPLSVTVLIGLFFIRDFADSALPAAGLTGTAVYWGHVGSFLGGLVLALVFTLQDDDTAATRVDVTKHPGYEWAAGMGDGHQ